MCIRQSRHDPACKDREASQTCVEHHAHAEVEDFGVAGCDIDGEIK